MDVFRQGDVLVARVERIPDGARPKADLVLARGEITGHAHRVQTDSRAELYELDTNLFLRVLGSPAKIIHEEHGPIELAPGDYRVWRQREYDPISEKFLED